MIAVFGPNASGKSTVLRALSFIAWFVQNSFAIPPNARLPLSVERRREPASANPPGHSSRRAGSPAQADNPDAPQCLYVYELTIGGRGPTCRDERNAALPPIQRRAARAAVFARLNGRISAAKAFGLSGDRQVLQKVLRPTPASSPPWLTRHPYGTLLWNAAALVLSNILIEKGDGRWTRWSGTTPPTPRWLTVSTARSNGSISAFAPLNCGRGTGPIALFHHEGLSGPSPLLYESHGTRQFLKLYPTLLHTLETGGVAVLDELDAAIDPVMLSEILRWFHDRERNPHDAQL